MSNFELKIASILREAHIDFIMEYAPPTLRKGLYRYDFFIPRDNIFIECNGAQHYTFTPYFYKNQSAFKKAQERDRRKCSYCLAHNFQLYCLPYWDLDKINSVSDIFNSSYLVTSKFHNDEVLQRFQNHKA